MSRLDFLAYPCPKCGAAIGARCVSASGTPKVAAHDVHVARLRVRGHRPPEQVLPRYDYPKRPKAVGVIVLSPTGVQVLVDLVAGR